MNGLQDEIRNSALKEKAHLIWEGKPKEFKAQDLAFLKSHQQLEKSELRLQSEGIVTPLEVGALSLGSGVIIEASEKLKENEAILGSELAATLRMQPGDKAELRSVWKLKEKPLQITVQDIQSKAVYDLDRRVLVISKKTFEEWLQLKNHSSLLKIWLKDPYESEKLKSFLSEKTSVPLKTWKEVDSALWYSLKLEKWAMSIALFFIIILASLSLHFALSVRVTEKKREIALLRALGSSKKKLFLLYLIEGVSIGALGCFLAFIASFLFCYGVENYAQLPDIFFNPDIPVRWDVRVSIIYCLITVFFCFLASWGPANKVSQSGIAETLRS